VPGIKIMIHDPAHCSTIKVILDPGDGLTIILKR
jgi:hypothetical protein